MLDAYMIFLIGVCLLSGAANTLGFTLQNKQPVVEYHIKKNFFHPYMQVAMRMVSNSFSLILFLILRYKNKGKAKTLQQVDPNLAKEKKAPLILYMIPTLLDYFAVLCYYVALNFIPGSVYQILRGGTVLTTYLFSYTCLNARPTRSKIYGCTIVLLGLVTVGVINFTLGTTQTQQASTLVGYGLIFIALFGNGLHYVYQEHLVVEYGSTPMQIVGMQGLFGVLISIVFIPLMGITPCVLANANCVSTQSGNAVVQHVGVYFRQLGDTPYALIGVLLVICSMSLYNTVGVAIVKKMNCLARSLIDVSRTIIIWFVGLALSGTLGVNDKRFQWQSLYGWQIFGESIGFTVLIIGNLIYYDIIVLWPGAIKPQPINSQSVLDQDAKTEKIKESNQEISPRCYSCQ